MSRPLIRNTMGRAVVFPIAAVILVIQSPLVRFAAGQEAALSAELLENDKRLIEKITKPVGTVPVHWRVTWHSDPATEAVVSWSTVEPGSKHELHVRSADGGYKKSIACQRNGEFSRPRGGQFRLYYHHARLSGLKPATQYFVQCESDGQKSPEMWFLTAPDQDKAVRLLYGSDSRTGFTQRRMMNRRMVRLVEEMPEILGLVHGGDYIDDGKSLEDWWLWLADHELTLSDKGRLLPLIPARGNHEPGPIFDEVFDFPAGDGNYYAVSVTPQVRVITLNSEASMGGSQKQWLEQELAASRPKFRWIIVQYHRPAWAAVKFPGPPMRHAVPLLEKYNVDLVCEADGHCLKRTVPIRADKHDPTGIVYVGEGGLGVGQNAPKSDRWYLQPPGMAISAYHVQLLTFNPDRLEYKAIGHDGAMLDQYTKIKPNASIGSR